MAKIKPLAILAVLLSIFVFLSSWGSKYAPLVSDNEILQTAEPTKLPDVSPVPLPSPTPTPYIFVVPDVTPYSDGVSKRSVRYVSQLNDVSENGWGKYSWKAGMECTTACISMALSYLGVDASPEAILDYSSKTVLPSTYGMDNLISFSSLTSMSISENDRFPLFSSMFEKYIGDEDGNCSPVLLYIQGNGHYHAILVIGKDGDSYLAVDPTPAGIHKVKISEDGELTTDEEGYLVRYGSGESSNITINSLAQWHTADNVNFVSMEEENETESS